MAKLNKKTMLVLFASWIGVVFAGGYYYGRSTSTKWNDEETAYLYMCHASHWDNPLNPHILFLHMPDGSYAFDGQHVVENPDWGETLSRHLPVVGREEYQNWLDTTVEGIAAAGATQLVAKTYGLSTSKTLERMSKNEWSILAIASAGSFAAGYVLGHRFTEDFHAPKFRAALEDDKTWNKVWTLRKNLLQAKATLDRRTAALAEIKENRIEDAHKRAMIVALEGETKKEYALIYSLDPDLRTSTPLQPTQAQP